MRDLSGLLIGHPFPAALPHIRRAFVRQPDRQTCGASAIRHGLLLGGLTIPTATLEAVLDIRAQEGTSPAHLRACLQRLGLEVRHIRKPSRRSTAAFFDSLQQDFAQGGFLIPCIHGAEHWVCIGNYQDGLVCLVDSFSDRPLPWDDLDPELGFFSLSPDELDAIDWHHFVTLVRPGIWRSQYEAWLSARPALLRMNKKKARTNAPLTLEQAIQLGVHQYLDDSDHVYRELHLHLPDGLRVSVRADDPGNDALGMELPGRRGDCVVFRRLEGLLSGKAAPPELVLRAGAVCAGYLSP